MKPQPITGTELKHQRETISNTYFNYFYGIALTRFKWHGLPPEILPQAIEDYLFWSGSAIFFKNQKVDLYAVMRDNEYGMVDIYGMGNERVGYANQYIEFLDKKDSVLLRDSYSGYPLSRTIRLFAESIADMRITRDINIRAQRTPFITSGNGDNQLTMRTIYNQIDQGIPYIPLDKRSVYPEDIQVLNVNAPVVFRTVSDEMVHEIVMCLNMMGVYASYSTKRERENVAETSGNAGEVEIVRNGGLDLRKRSAEQINRLFGLNVSVEFNSALPLPVIKSPDSTVPQSATQITYDNLDTPNDGMEGDDA